MKNWKSWVNKSFTTIPIQSFIDGKKVSPMFLQADELEGDPIVEFGSAGPKSYCYLIVGGKSDCKNKGTKSSYEINQVLNCGSMMQYIQQELTNPFQCRRMMHIDIKNHFVKENTHKTVRLHDLVKVFGVNWDKRVVEKGTGKTYPYGYVRLDSN